jgi:hypothetical protein
VAKYSRRITTMTKKNNNLINEGVVRRWGKLANLTTLTESFLDNATEEEALEEAEHEEEVVEVPADLEAMDMDEPMDEPMDDMEAQAAVEVEPTLDISEEDLVDLVKMIADASGADVTVSSGDAEGEMADAEGEMADAEGEMADAEGDMADAEEEIEAAMRSDMAYNRDETETETDTETEELDENEKTELVDEEALTEAILNRVIARILKK